MISISNLAINNLLASTAAPLLAQDLDLRIKFEERKVKLCVYRRARNAKAQTITAITERGSFPL